MSSYQPPHKRQTIASEKINERNVFLSSMRKEAQTPKTPDFEMNEELFPSLNKQESHTETENSKSMNYASSLFKAMPKKKEKKDIEDGWIRILPGKQYIYGKKSKEFKQLKRWIQTREWIKRELALDKILERHERFNAMELYQNGPKHYTNFELQQYLEQIEKEKKRELSIDSNDESTSEDDYESGNE